MQKPTQIAVLRCVSGSRNLIEKLTSRSSGFYYIRFCLFLMSGARIASDLITIWLKSDKSALIKRMGSLQRAFLAGLAVGMFVPFAALYTSFAAPRLCSLLQRVASTGEALRLMIGSNTEFDIVHNWVYKYFKLELYFVVSRVLGRMRCILPRCSYWSLVYLSKHPLCLKEGTKLSVRLIW